MSDRVPDRDPRRDEAEISVLGAAMLKPEAADRVRQRLQREDLEHNAHRAIYTAIDRLRTGGHEADAVAVASELERDGLLEQAGGRDYLALIVDRVPTAANVEYHIGRVAEDSDRRRLREALKAAEKMVSANGKPPGELRADVLTVIEKTAPRMTEGPAFHTLAEILADSDALKPPPVIVPRMACRQRVTLLSGREKDGKTTLGASAAAAVSTGAEFLDEPCPQGTVLVVALDEHLHDTAQKLVRFKADPDRTFLVTDLGADRIAGLGNVVRATAPDLTLIDSLSNLTGGLISDGGQAVQWAPHMAAVVAIARQTRTGIILIHHATKSGSGYRDSGQIGASVDMILEMSAGGDDRTREIRARGRWPLEDYTLRLNGDLTDPAAHLWYDLDPGALPLAVRTLLYVEQHPGCSKAEVRRNVSGRAQDVDAEIDRLLHRGAIANRGDSRSWKLCAENTPDAQWDALDAPERVQ